MRNFQLLALGAVIAFTACTPGITEQEKVRRAVIGTWMSPDLKNVYTFSDGGALTYHEPSLDTTGTWTVSPTGGIALSVTTFAGPITLAASWDGNSVSVAAQNGGQVKLLREADAIKSIPPLTDAQIQSAAAARERLICGENASISYQHTDQEADPQYDAFNAWMTQELKQYRDNGGGTYIRNGHDGVPWLINWSSYGGLQNVSFCTIEFSHIDAITRQQLSPTKIQTSFRSNGDYTAFYKEALQSPWASSLRKTPGTTSKNNITFSYNSESGWTFDQ